MSKRHYHVIVTGLTRENDPHELCFRTEGMEEAVAKATLWALTELDIHGTEQHGDSRPELAMLALAIGLKTRAVAFTGFRKD